jgi:hypothetical protein
MSLGFGELKELEKQLEYFEREKDETAISRYVQFNLPDPNSFVPSIKNTEVTRTPDEIVIKNLIDVFPEIVEEYPQLVKKEIKEPKPTPEKAKYGQIVVKQTHSGHVFTQDDTPGNRRVITQHATGTYISMIDDGSMIVHITKDGMKIVNENYQVYIQKDRLTLIDGNDWIQVKMNKTSHVNQNEYKVIGVDKKTKIGQNEKKEIGQNQDISIGQNQTIQVGQNITIQAGGNIKINGQMILLNC